MSSSVSTKKASREPRTADWSGRRAWAAPAGSGRSRRSSSRPTAAGGSPTSTGWRSRARSTPPAPRNPIRESTAGGLAIDLTNTVEYGKNAAPTNADHLVFQLLERRQSTQRTKVRDQLGQAMHVVPHVTVEARQPSAVKVARLAKKFMERLFRVCQVFESLRVGYGQRPATQRIPRGLPQRGFINEQPSFLHPHRNHANNRQRRVDLAFPQGFANLLLALVHRFTFGIPVHEEQVARIQLDALGDTLKELPGWIPKATQV